MYEMEEFPNYFGTTGTAYASHIIWFLNNGNDVFTGDIELVGDLIIDQDFTLLNCKVRISPNVRIRVEADVTFTLDGSKLFCCQNMWQGIDLNDRSAIVSRNVTEIEDAMVAMESPCSATLSIRNTVFNRNEVGIRLGYDGPIPWDPCHTFPIFTQFAGNTFQCTAPLNGSLNGVSFVGVQVYKTNATIGALTSAPNTFRNIRYGIRLESQRWGASAVNRCIFDRVLNDGIFMAQGNLQVERCTFMNTGFRGINVLSTRGLVVKYSNFNCNDDVAAQVGGDNTYHHIRAGAFAVDCSVEISHNFFGCNFTDPGKAEHLRGIELMGGVTMGGGTNIRVDWNTFHFTVVQNTPVLSSEVSLTGEYPSNTSTIIEFNNFYLDQPSENFPNTALIGIVLSGGNKNQVQLYGNNFESEAWWPFATWSTLDEGIEMTGSMGGGNIVTGNTIAGSPESLYSVDFYFGIWSVDFINTLYCENDLKESAIPMAFLGTSMGTQYFANTHTGGGHSLEVFDGFIGEQGFEGGEHHGNKWYDKWLNVLPTLHAYHWPTFQAPNSRIFVHTPQSVLIPPGQGLGYSYFSDLHPARISPDQMDEWFKEDPSGYPGAGGCIDHIIGSTETDRAIAGGTINLTGLSQAHAWTAKRYLYAKLVQNQDLQDDHAEFGPFLSDESQTSVGQLYAVEQKIAEGLTVSGSLATQLSQIKTGENLALCEILLADSILNTAGDSGTLIAAQNDKVLRLEELRTLDSLYAEINVVYQAALMSKLQEALALNDAVIVVADYERYEKAVNDIAIRQVLYQSGVLTAAQVDTLNAIAAECPKFGGHGVYRARGLLTGCNEGNWSDDYAECYPRTAPLQEQVIDNGFDRSSRRHVAARAFAYPNPATDGTSIRIPSASEGQITLRDMTGIVRCRVPFTKGDEAKYVDLANVPHGVYTCVVESADGERQAIKVFVVKP